MNDNEGSKNLSSPEEVLKFIDEHNQRSNDMVDESRDVLSKIVKMNKEIANEIDQQNKVISSLDKQIDKGEEIIKSNNSKLDDLMKKTSNYTLITTMVIQIIVILFLVFL